eukprot:GHVT01049455.1.p1 GENE.GHVT01049455.1~~GHVT01049455.1.p1  ORF type:complete len:161 (+),score=20.16 GHVT01049455.1:1127-1609(+)
MVIFPFLPLASPFFFFASFYFFLLSLSRLLSSPCGVSLALSARPLPPFSAISFVQPTCLFGRPTRGMRCPATLQVRPHNVRTPRKFWQPGQFVRKKRRRHLDVLNEQAAYKKSFFSCIGMGMAVCKKDLNGATTTTTTPMPIDPLSSVESYGSLNQPLLP